MKQPELEQFIGELAGAEQAAAAKIQSAEKRWQRKITKRRNTLEQKRQDQLDALEADFGQQEGRLREELEQYRLQEAKKTDACIKALQSIYDDKSGELINWLVSKVTRP